MNDTQTSEIEKLREQFRPLFRFVFKWGFVLIVATALVGILAILFYVFTDKPDEPLPYIHLVARMLHISLGFVIGFFLVFIGLVACWMGLEAQVKLKGNYDSASLSLVTASPGIVLMICGTMLLSICLLKSSSVEVRSLSPPSVESAEKNVEGELSQLRMEFKEFVTKTQAVLEQQEHGVN